MQVAATGNVEAMRSDFSVSLFGVHKDSARHVVQDKDRDHLSDADRQALFSGLRATLQRPENCEGAGARWSVIEQALLQNPRMMRKMKSLQDMGAELVVTEFREGQYVEFADAAVNLDIRRQEETLACLAAKERDDAIEQILQPLSVDQKEPARTWILSQLSRSKNAKGLNWVEALVLAVAHGGTLISYVAYDAMAPKDTSIVENATWTWYLKSLSDVMKSGDAPYGNRRGGKARRGVNVADYRGGGRGGRVAGLRVPLVP